MRAESLLRWVIWIGRIESGSGFLHPAESIALRYGLALAFLATAGANLFAFTVNV